MDQRTVLEQRNDKSQTTPLLLGNRPETQSRRDLNTWEGKTDSLEGGEAH